MGSQREACLVCAVCGNRQHATDALTGLADRGGFRQVLEEQVEQAQRGGGGEFAVVLIDLDRFKAVNDTLGHNAGDALLKAVAGRLRRVVRASDVVARLGGDEFAILLLAPADPAVVTGIAARIVDLLSQAYMIEGRVANIGASAGIVLGTPDGSIPADLLVRQADLAMYQAKADGRGRYAFFEPALQERAEARRLLEMDLRAALPLQQFELYYQPQVDVQQNRLSGFEALIRWRHPERGLVPPGSFIGFAEEIGLIGAIGEWVIGTACAEAATWPGALTVAVNVAPQQFERGALVRTVQAALEESGLPPRRLELEVTESALLRPGKSTLAQLNALKELGVQVSLDDFGTGYSSLTQLRSFSFDRVKIDRSFVDDPAVVRAVAALARSLGMRTTAEGIETPQQMDRLRADGCTDIQGYLLSPPVPASRVGALIGRLAHAAPMEQPA